MEKQFIQVVFVVFYVIFCENNSQLTSRGMVVAYSFEISDGNSTGISATTIAHEYFTTEYVMKVENRSTYSPIVQSSNNDGLQEKGANETDDKDYSGDVDVESNVSPTVFMEREVTRVPLTANAQYFADGKEADSSADSEDRTTLKPSKNSEISDFYSEVVTNFEFSGNSQLETSDDDDEQSDDLSKEIGFEVPGSESSGEEGFYFTPDSEGFIATMELDLGARSTEKEYPSLKVTVEETKVSTSKYSALNVENNSYISAVPKDADNYHRNPFLKSGHSSLMPTKLFGGIRRITRPTGSGGRRNKANGKVTAESVSMASVVNNRRHYTPDKYEASKVNGNMASTIFMEIDPEGVLLGQNESILNARPDNSLQQLYLQNVVETSPKNHDYSNIPEGRAATDFKKSSTSVSSEHSRLDERIDEEKSRAVFISTSPPNVKTSTKDYVLQSGVELALNSTAHEQSDKFDLSQNSLMICSVIIIPLVIVAIITVIVIRRYHHRKNCCTKTGTNVEESRREECPSIQLSEVIVDSGTDPPPIEHLSIDQEA